MTMPMVHRNIDPYEKSQMQVVQCQLITPQMMSEIFSSSLGIAGDGLIGYQNVQ